MLPRVVLMLIYLEAVVLSIVAVKTVSMQGSRIINYYISHQLRARTVFQFGITYENKEKVVNKSFVFCPSTENGVGWDVKGRIGICTVQIVWGVLHFDEGVGEEWF
jgi:hypothetical protein